ncbi:MAG TPA: TlpA disulfide reductase family protein [Isosphaeraceae bacterium]|nr:TlpA disulfide reductase family protein [Isosphaeraceae bacterium]
MTEPPVKSDRTWWIIGLGFVIAWVLYLIFFGPKPTVELSPPRLATSAEPKEVDYGWTVRDLHEKPVPFERYRGKAVFLNIWATWCPPCVAELPSIARLAADPRLKEVAFLCVSTDESAEAVRGFLRGKDWPMAVLRATSLPDVLTTDGIPATFLVAPDGRIVATEVGAAAWDDPTAVEYLEKLARPAAEVRP